MNRTYALLLAGFLLSASFAHGEAVHGVLMVVKGTVKIQSGKDQKISPAKIGGKVFPQDTIITEKDSRAKIVMSDKNEINVSPETKLSLEKYIYNPQKDEKNVILNVVYGKVRSQVNQKYDGDQKKFHVKTPSAVAGVRGTDFLASFDAGTQTSKVVTFSGVVEVGQPGAGGSIANSVRVSPGQFTTASPNSPPAPPAAVPKAEFNQMNQETKAETAKPDDKGTSEGDKNGGKKDDGKKDEGKKDDGKKDEGKKEDGKKDESAKKDEGVKKEDGKKDASRGTANGDSAKGDGKAESKPKEASNGNGPASEKSGSTRAPASEPPQPASGGSMIDKRDLGPALLGNNGVPDFSNHSGGSYVEIPPAIRPAEGLPPKCDFCDRQISNGPTKLNIQINVQ